MVNQHPVPMNEEDKDKALEQVFKASNEGRKILMDYFGHLRQVKEKHQAGLVSEADVQSEKAIVSSLLSQFPHHNIIGEEQTFVSDLHQGPVKIAPEVPTWIIDPLDGTTNYVHGFHIFCISIGLQYQNQMVVGLVDVPVLNQTYFAVRGRGAFVKDGNSGKERKLQVSSRSTLEEALLATGFSSYDEKVLNDQLSVFSQLVRQVRGVRRGGSSAYDLCQVAEGIFDGYWEKNLSPWDTAAGLLLVEEAGGKVTNYSGDPFAVQMKSILASSSLLHSSLEAVLKTIA